MTCRLTTLTLTISLGGVVTQKSWGAEFARRLRVLGSANQLCVVLGVALLAKCRGGILLAVGSPNIAAVSSDDARPPVSSVRPAEDIAYADDHVEGLKLSIKALSQGRQTCPTRSGTSDPRRRGSYWGSACSADQLVGKQRLGVVETLAAGAHLHVGRAIASTDIRLGCPGRACRRTCKSALNMKALAEVSPLA